MHIYQHPNKTYHQNHYEDIKPIIEIYKILSGLQYCLGEEYQKRKEHRYGYLQLVIYFHCGIREQNTFVIRRPNDKY
jgi:hypothetical protein